MKKKVLSVVLASAMALSLAACANTTTDNGAATDNGSSATENNTADNTADNTAAAEEEAYQLSTLRMVVDGTLTANEDNRQDAFEEQWEKAVSEKMGYAIDLVIDQQDHSGYKDAVGRILLGGDLPDVMIMSADMYKQYQTTGLLWNMADAYENAEFQSRMDMPLINENMKTADGALYGFAPYYGNGCVTYVKQSWADAVGIDLSTVKTYDDYINLLTAFATGDPDGNGVDGDTYGVIAAGFGKMDEAPYINYMAEFYQGAYPAILQGEDGVWYDGFQTQEMKDALLRMQDAYNKKLIDPETLTASTKIAREKFFSNDQTGSSGAFTYWAGTWYQTLTDNLIKNEVDTDLVMLAPIKEITDTWGGYLNREAPVWVILDDGDGNDAREQAIFDAFIETMLDGGTVQTLWTYGAEDVHWTTHAEEFVLNAGTDKEKAYSYEEGEFHLKQTPNDPNALWKKNLIDPALVVAHLNDDTPAAAAKGTDLATQGNKFFTANCVDAPAGASCQTLTDYAADIADAKNTVIASVVTQNGDVDAAMEGYKAAVGAIIDQALAELNAQ